MMAVYSDFIPVFWSRVFSLHNLEAFRRSLPQMLVEGGTVLDMPAYQEWKEAVFTFEKSGEMEPGRLLFVLHPEDSGAVRVGVEPGAKMRSRITCVPVDSKAAFANRLSLPQEWRGLRGAELDAAIQRTAERRGVKCLLESTPPAGALPSR
jgi:uncharacterized UPF0160 family protein